MPPTKGKDAITLLKEDHKKVKGLLSQLELTQSRLEAGPEGLWYGVWVKAGLPGPRGAGPVR